jgi:hypothetical protein
VLGCMHRNASDMARWLALHVLSTQEEGCELLLFVSSCHSAQTVARSDTESDEIACALLLATHNDGSTRAAAGHAVNIKSIAWPWYTLCGSLAVWHRMHGVCMRTLPTILLMRSHDPQSGTIHCPPQLGCIRSPPRTFLSASLAIEMRLG